MRDYLSVSETTKTIINEVIDGGMSGNWSPANANTLTMAQELEQNLAKFNIGLTDPKQGIWRQRSGGTRYFATMKALGFAKNKVSSLISSLRR